MKRALPILALCAVACSDDSFVPRWRVERLRVLAVLADPPDARPGETLTLSVHTAAPRGAMETPEVRWVTCPRLTLDTTTSTPRCAGFPSVFAGTTVRVTLDTAPDGGAPWTFLGFACLGGRVVLDATAATFRCEGGDGEVFLRSVRVRRGAPNHNPRIAGITLDDLPLRYDGVTGVTAGRTGMLRVEFADGAREDFTETQPDGSSRSTREALLTQFLTDTGTLDGAFRSDGDGTPGTHTMPFTTPTHGSVRLWVVLSDGRGGFDFATRTLTVEP